jgi:nucleoside 2-deoxyribosyltransferase
MALTPSIRATYRTEIAHRLSPKSWPEIDVILEEFSVPTTDNWGSDEFSYILSMLKGVSDFTLQQLAIHLHIETGEDSIVDPPAFWAEGQLCVFISHLAKHKVFASELQLALSAYGISSFVAHEDIEPDAEWQAEIEKALRTCDALLALLHDGFKESTWTDQEVGYALGRGVPVFSVRLEVAPYGLLGKKQAFNGKEKDAATIGDELAEAYLKHPKAQIKMSDGIIAKFCRSSSFAEAKENCSLVERLEMWKPQYKELLRAALTSNAQVSGSWGVSERIERLLAKRDPDPVQPSDNYSGDEIPF